MPQEPPQVVLSRARYGKAEVRPLLLSPFGYSTYRGS
jgi:5-hydroxyisourate hydrolase-like protein (transthyretin family)